MKFAFVFCTLLFAAVCYAEGPSAGRYVGSFTAPSLIGDIAIGVELNIEKVANGIITGTGNYHGKACRGQFTIIGSYSGNDVIVRSAEKFGPAGDCRVGFRLKVEGSKLLGETMGKGYPAQFTK